MAAGGVQFDLQPSSGYIGVHVFQGSSTPHINRIDTDKKIVKRLKKQFGAMPGKTPAGVIVNLANGSFVSGISKGAEGFFWRDFERIAKISAMDPQDGLTGAYLVPPEWLSSVPGLVDPSQGAKKYQDAMSSNVFTQGQKRKREEELRGYKGEGPEKAFYEEVKKYAQQSGHELVFFHGVHFSKPGLGEQEIDSILVDRTLGAVVVTEIKASLNKTHGTLQHALKQVEEAKQLMENWFGDLIKSFKFIGTVFGETLDPGVTINPSCSPFVMVGAGEILPNLINLKNELNKAGHTPTAIAMDYRELVKYMLFCVHANKSGATVDSKMTREVEERVLDAGSADNIHYWSCWTPNQLGLMMRKGLRYVLLPSSMCTGKTECLVGKAMEKAEEGEKVLFVTCGRNCIMKSLLYFKLKRRFQSYGNIKLHYLNIKLNKQQFCIQELSALIQKYPGHSVFTDELVLPRPEFLSEVAKDVDKLRMELDNDTGPFRCLWITVAGGEYFTDADFTDARLASIFKLFYITNMKIPLRGTKYVSTAAGNNKICGVDHFKSRVDVEIPSNLVEGIAPAIFTFNNLTEAEVAEAVRQAMDLVNREEGIRGVSLLLDDGTGPFYFWVAQGVVAAGRATPLQYGAASFSPDASDAEVEQWLQGGNTRPDLITTARQSRGWEEAVVVAVNIGQNSNIWGPENLYLRCISRLIIVKNA